MKFARSLAVFSALFLAACASVPGGGQGIEQPISQQTPKTETSERARVHVELGRMYLAEGRFDIALDEAKLAAEIEPSYALSYDLMGLIYMALRQNEAASTAFRQALRLAPHDPEINNDYGWFLCQGGDPRGGLGHIERALANPLYAAPLKALTNAGLCALLAKDDTRAEHYFRRALTLERAHATALFWLADIAFRQGRLHEAKRYLDELHGFIEPSASSAWLALRVERKLGNREAEARHQGILRRNFRDSAEYQKLIRGEFD